MPLQAPGTDFSDLPLHIRYVSVTLLKRIGRRNSGEPFFGRYAAYRFDDPGKHFGACYCGLQLDTAIAETVLHDEIPEKGEFRVRQEDIDTRYLVTFATGTDNGMLKLANLTGRHLKRLGGDNSLSAEFPYDMTQRWSAAVHAHPDLVDGFMFVSKQLNNRLAAVVFDRAKPKFGYPTYTPLGKVRGLTQAKKRLGIVSIGAGAVSSAEHDDAPVNQRQHHWHIPAGILPVSLVPQMPVLASDFLASS